MALSLQSVFLLIVWTSTPLVFCQYNCDKYCLKSCSDYFPGPEFSKCVDARIHCSCETRFAVSNPLVIFLIVASIFVGIFCCGLCCRYSRRNNYTSISEPHRIVAYPIQETTVNSAVPIRGNNVPAHTNIPPQRGYTGPPLAPQLNPVPQEYVEPPPAYNECVKNAKFQSETDKLIN